MFPKLRLRRAARQRFGWPQLRPQQLTAMRALVRGQDALVVLPTGGGKSAIYQVPATLLRGPTVVVSPLLALQQDQLTNLNERGSQQLKAVRVSSAESPKQQEQALAELRAGRARFLFITPEQLAREDRVAQVAALRPALIAIDEAHCVSTWGDDFRPDYLGLKQIIEQLGRPPIVALTATASPPVREDIVARLGMADPVTVLSGLDRPNIFLEVAHCPSEDVRWRRLIGLLRQDPGQGIIYVATRRAAEELSAQLTDAGYMADHYHGGMAAGARERKHLRFLDGQIPIMVATSAFGMGIDKPDIRWVAHMALPDSPDSYLQEIGRAGRDGGPARALLLWRPEDVALQRYFAGGTPDIGDIYQVVVGLRQGPAGKAALAKSTSVGTRKLAQLLGLLEQVGAVTSATGSKLVLMDPAADPARTAHDALTEAERRQAVQLTRTEMMRGFAQTKACRAKPLLAYFGEHLAHGCGHCDNCHGERVTPSVVDNRPLTVKIPAQRTGGEPFPVHSTVQHTEWGTGTVLSYEADRMTVLFDEVGYKTLSVPVVRANRLLTAVAPA